MTAPSLTQPIIDWGNGNIVREYVITATGGTGHLFLVNSPTGVGGITRAEMITVAGDLTTELEGLTGVSAVSMAIISPDLSANEWLYFPSLVQTIQLDTSWTIHGYDMLFSGGESTIHLALSSPADGVLGSTDVSNVISWLATELSGVSGVTSVTDSAVPTVTLL